MNLYRRGEFTKNCGKAPLSDGSLTIAAPFVTENRFFDFFNKLSELGRAPRWLDSLIRLIL